MHEVKTSVSNAQQAVTGLWRLSPMDFGDDTMERNGMVGKNGWQGGTSEMAAAPAHAKRLLKIAR